MRVYESTVKNPILSWCMNPEEGALAQAKNLASLPFIFKHVALMPDTHQGYGMPIGGVIATQGVVIPNAVGVDIGCFSGDMKVPLLNGKQKTFKELVKENKTIYVYSLNKKLKLVPGKATAMLTRKKGDLLEVTISGGETIKCTLDHKFMMIDGSYKEAKDLKPFDSLMPLYRSYETKDGYEHIKTTPGTGVTTHKMVAEYFFGKRKKSDITHHKDECWFNNDPNNLEYKNAKLHNRDHAKKNCVFKTEEFKEKRLDKLNKNGFFDSKFLEKKQDVARKNLEQYNRSAKKKENDKLAGQRGKEFLIKYNKSEKGRKKSSEIGKKHGFGKNHKVLYIKKLSVKQDVYCLNVEKYHNFALSAGVFVHNCGMIAVKTSLKDISTDQLKRVLGGSKEFQGGIRSNIPVGFNHHSKKQDINSMPRIKGQDGGFYHNLPNLIAKDDYPIVKNEFNSALKQLGTLGGGNHFIEIQKGDDGFIWIMIHSGSRNLGFKVAKHYNKVAQDLCKMWYSDIPEYKGEDGLAFLPIGTKEASGYLREMSYCLDFAYTNRLHMMENVKKAFEDAKIVATFEKEINIHHNYAVLENHFGKNVWIHKKGATSAKEGELGIIPGSQGTASYIVKGKGNRDSFMSCSHGAGRKMSRKKARNELNLETEQKLMDDQGILHALRGKGGLDEAPGAYKDIQTVMDEQKDLVDIVVKLKPLAVVKG